MASFDRYVSSFVASLGSGAGGGGDTGGGGTGGGGDGGPVLPPLLPGDLLASWAGQYHGSWQVETLEAYVKVPTLTSPFYKWVRDPLTEEAMGLAMQVKTFLGGGCNWTVNTRSVQLGTLTIPFAEAYAVAASGEARTYTLPVSLTVLDLGVSGTTTLNTQGVLPTRIALAYHYKGLLKELRYSGACTFTYKS